MWSDTVEKESIGRAFSELVRLRQEDQLLFPEWSFSEFDDIVSHGKRQVWPLKTIQKRNVLNVDRPAFLKRQYDVLPAVIFLYLPSNDSYFCLEGSERISTENVNVRCIEFDQVSEVCDTVSAKMAVVKNTRFAAPRIKNQRRLDPFDQLIKDMCSILSLDPVKLTSVNDFVQKASFLSAFSNFPKTPVRVRCAVGSVYRFFRVFGPPGAGKTTLANRLKIELKADVVDVDDIVDSVFLKFRNNLEFVKKLESVDSPFDLPEFCQETEKVFLQWMSQRSSSVIVMLGVWFTPADSFVTDFIYLETDMSISYKRLIKREAETVANNSARIAEITQKSPLHMVPHDIHFLCKVRVGVLVDYNEYKNWGDGYLEQYPECRRLTAEQIFNEIVDVFPKRKFVL